MYLLLKVIFLIVLTYENTSTVILNIININFGPRYLLKKI